MCLCNRVLCTMFVSPDAEKSMVSKTLWATKQWQTTGYKNKHTPPMKQSLESNLVASLSICSTNGNRKRFNISFAISRCSLCTLSVVCFFLFYSIFVVAVSAESKLFDRDIIFNRLSNECLPLIQTAQFAIRCTTVEWKNKKNNKKTPTSYNF